MAASQQIENKLRASALGGVTGGAIFKFYVGIFTLSWRAGVIRMFRAPPIHFRGQTDGRTDRTMDPSRPDEMLFERVI